MSGGLLLDRYGAPEWARMNFFPSNYSGTPILHGENTT